MAGEGTPLLTRAGTGRSWGGRSLRLVWGGLLLVLIACCTGLLSLGRRHALELVGVVPAGGTTKMNLAKGQVLVYHDWRGMSLEEKDSYSFSHTWTGDINIGHTEQHIVKPAVIEIEGDTAGASKAAPVTMGAISKPPQAVDVSTGVSAVAAPAAASVAAAGILEVAKDKAQTLYMVTLEGNGWDMNGVQGLLDAFSTVCGESAEVAAKTCELSKSSWTVKNGKLVDDVSVAPGNKVTVSDLALTYARARPAKMDGVEGTVRSKRMQHSVMRVVTDWGNKDQVVDAILDRMFGATLNVPMGYTKLTQVTTVEDGARFMKFKPRELMLCLEAWSDMPEHMHRVQGLRYVTRRQQGLNHPLYGSTTAVSWPTNLDQSYQEYMDYSFNNDAYTSRHLFIHEKTHFFWGREWDEQLKKDWEMLGGWEREEGTAHGWVTKRSTPFTSGYGSRNSPDEDMAESMAAYVLHPNLLQARSEAKYKFFVDKMMAGRRYVERPDVPFTVESKDGYYGLPAKVKHVKIDVVGGQDEDKEVSLELLMDPGEGWHSPTHVEIALTGPTSGSHTLKLSKKEDWVPSKGEEGLVAFVLQDTMSKYYEGGFWSAKQIKITDDLSNTRWMMVDQYSWRLYLNNKQGTTWAPRYLHKTLKLDLTTEVDPKTKVVMPVFTATARFQQTGAPLTGDASKVPVWMRLAAHRSGAGAGLTEPEWKASNGPGGSNYPLYHEGTCEKDHPWTSDGNCTVKFSLAPTWPAGEYYVSMMSLSDIAGNTRAQFYTQQPDGIVCCGRIGNQDDDERPSFVQLPLCAAGTKPAMGNPCVLPDALDPELDISSVVAAVTPRGSPLPSAAATDAAQAKAGWSKGSQLAAALTAAADESEERDVVVSFKGRDLGGSGIGSISYRIMDPQGYSHKGWVQHSNDKTTVFDGDASQWATYDARLALPKGSPAGEWKVESIELHDKAGNRRNFQLIELLVFEPTGVNNGV